ncbi:MAG: hypothetical protein WD942_04830 [Dehalococcoidia bacterium]
MPTEREITRLRRTVGISGHSDIPQLDLPAGIVQFVTGLLGERLSPRQGTLLKMMTCDLDALTDYDLAVIKEWGAGFGLDGDGVDLAFRGERGTTPDVLDRMRWCRAQGRSTFHEVVLVLGRRGSKSLLTSFMCVWQLWKLLAMEDPQGHYQMPAGKRLTVLVFSVDQGSARRDAFGDILRLLTSAACFKPFLGAQTTTAMSLLTPVQLRAGARPGLDEGSIVITAAASTGTAGRGPASPVVWFDEIAHAQGAGSTVDSTDLYGSTLHATAQFHDALIVQSSTPWEMSGQLYLSYRKALRVDTETRTATHPGMLMVQLESPALYVDHERAAEIEMWPGGPHYPAGLTPKITYQYIEEQHGIDPHRARVELYAQFGAVADPYLLTDRVAFIYEGRRLVQQDAGTLSHRYVGHADPSKSNANFGFAIGHLEFDDQGFPHVIFDLIRHWDPATFPDGTINYFEVNEQIYSYIRAFRIAELTFDQYSSVEAIQGLQNRAFIDGLEWRPQIYERTATVAQNRRAYELFKTAVNAGLIHAPPHDLARRELEHLTLQGDKVVAPTSGPVRTKDLADALVNVTWTLLHERTDQIFGRLGGVTPSGSLPGGIPLANDPRAQLSSFGRRRAHAARQEAIRRAGEPRRRW